MKQLGRTMSIQYWYHLITPPLSFVLEMKVTGNHRSAKHALVVMLASLFMTFVTTSQANAEPDWSSPVLTLDVADYRGRVWHMDDFRDKPILVMAFLGTECPLAKIYATRLVELEQQYQEKGVSVVAVMSNRQDSIAEIAAFARRHHVEFPILKDAGNRLADAMGAERTPEVFVLDQQRQVRYWGRIDDQYGIGYQKVEPSQRDLEGAIDQLLAGQAVATPKTRSVGCIIGRQRSVDTDSQVTFSNEVVRILNRRCVECHREGEIAPFAISDYQEAAGWADMIAEVVQEQRMPPWHASPEHGHFANDRSLTEEEKQTLYQWAAAGAPEGDPADLPEPPQFVSGWQLPREPDQIVNCTQQPYEVPATGVVKYKYERVDLGNEHELWLEAAELLPGNRAVVHHILCFVRPKGSKERLEAERSFLVGYVPGARVEPNPAGMAKRIPANSELIFQIHYTPVGTPQTDQSKLGLVFTDPSKITHEIITYSAVYTNLKIKANDPEYRVTATIPEPLPNAQLLGMSPHMHLRGKAFNYEVIAPDGSRETVLDIPRYDFNWQTTYRLAEPMPLESGSLIRCTAVFDNSDKNLNNPDPNQVVRWGEQTTDEMMIGYFHYAVKRPDEVQLPAKAHQHRALEVFLLLDRDQDHKVSLNDVPAAMRSQAKQFDVDGDGTITYEEVSSRVRQ